MNKLYLNLLRSFNDNMDAKEVSICDFIGANIKVFIGLPIGMATEFDKR